MTAKIVVMLQRPAVSATLLHTNAIINKGSSQICIKGRDLEDILLCGKLSVMELKMGHCSIKALFNKLINK